MTFASLKACKAITHILYETLRLYPLAPINGRRALKDTVLPTGGGPDRKQPIAVRKGEQIRYSMYVMHRRHDIWGDDADEFRPDRWEKRKLGWEFIPFSGGPRVCLGRKSAQVYVNEFTLIPDTEQYALNEASFVIAKFLQDRGGRYVQPYQEKDSVDPVARGWRESQTAWSNFLVSHSLLIAL